MDPNPAASQVASAGPKGLHSLTPASRMATGQLIEGSVEHWGILLQTALKHIL
jgi:hypothetical protein